MGIPLQRDLSHVYTLKHSWYKTPYLTRGHPSLQGKHLSSHTHSHICRHSRVTSTAAHPVLLLRAMGKLPSFIVVEFSMSLQITGELIFVIFHHAPKFPQSLLYALTGNTLSLSFFDQCHLLVIPRGSPIFLIPKWPMPMTLKAMSLDVLSILLFVRVASALFAPSFLALELES